MREAGWSSKRLFGHVRGCSAMQEAVRSRKKPFSQARGCSVMQEAVRSWERQYDHVTARQGAEKSVKMLCGDVVCWAAGEECCEVNACGVRSTQAPYWSTRV